MNGSATSAPLALTVKLNDVNDNAPILPTFAPIYIQAQEGKRDIIKVFLNSNLNFKNIFFKSNYNVLGDRYW